MFAFLLTRLIVLAIFVVTAHVGLQSPSFGGQIQEISVEVKSGGGVLDRLRRTVSVADTLWFREIASQGYQPGPFRANRPHNWAFFPLYPMLLRAASFLTGELELTAMVLSSGCFLLALVLLHQAARAFGYDAATADRAVFYMAAFPTSYFYTLGVSESLFLLLTVGSLLAAAHDEWWIAGLSGGLASGTRAVGVLLAPALAVLHVERHGFSRRLQLLGLGLVPIGLVLYMAYLDRLTGNAFAFRDILVAWGRGSGPFWEPLTDYLSSAGQLSRTWDFRLLNFAAALLGLGCAGVLAWRRQWALALYTFSAVAVPLSSMLLQSTARYVMVAFPIFFVLGAAGRNPLVDQAIRAIFLVLLGLMSMLFAAHFGMAMS
jgi:hypothetical protein